MPNQNSAPLPQDVHPQAYQPAINGPPGPQWGAPGLSQAPQPAPAPTLNEYNRRLAEMQQNPQLPPQQHNPYDQRDGIRPPAPHTQARPASPRPEPLRQYHDPARPGPPPRRGLSPSPKSHNAVPSWSQGPQGLPPQPPPPQTQLPPHQPPPPQRISNPNYGGPAASVPPPPAGLNGPAHQGPMPGYNRMTSPPPEVRPIVENRPQSAGSNYPHQTYQHHPNPSALGGMASGAPAPAAAFAAAEAAQREREDRTPSGPKRHREWEDDHTMAPKPPNEEKRPRLDDHLMRRPSPPDRVPSPPRRSPPEAEARRLEDQRRINDGYHPSEAAHHPPTLPAMQHNLPPLSHPPEPVANDERKEQHEPAARQMDVDEDYDDEGEDDKRNGKSERSSPRSVKASSGMPIEQKA